MVQPTKPVRWRLLLWPLGLVALVAAAGLVAIWSTEQPQRQVHVVHTLELTGVALLVTGLWSGTWLLLLSRLRWRARLVALGAAGALAAALGLSLEFRGFSGDVVPKFGWRWSAGAAPVEAATAAARAAVTSSARDWPQFLGPHRDGTVTAVRLARDWSVPPRELWRRPMGGGWSSFAIAGEFAVTQEQRGEEELVTCYDLDSGELLWAHAERTRYDHPIGGPGPRATPTIHDRRVFALGATGRLNAFDLVTGVRLWSVDILEDTGARAPEHGVSASPLVYGDALVIAAGGADGQSLVGYDPETGARLWAGGDGQAAYGSPRFAELAGVPQILVLNGDTIASHDPADGRVLWEFEWPPGQNAFLPVVLPGDRIFVSTGYGVGGKLLRVRPSGEGGLAVDLVWESRGLKAKFTNVVHRDGFLYGLDDGILVCLDARTGKRRWKRGRYGHGQILLIDDLLLVLGEDGTVTLVEAAPEAHRELGRFGALDGKTWGHPALAGPRLVVRNDSEAACFELPLAAGG